VKFQTRQYRQRIYDNYVSGMLRPDRWNYLYSAEIIRSWADAAKVRLRGWLPEELATCLSWTWAAAAGQFLYLLDQLGYTDLTGVDLSEEQVHLAGKWCPSAKIIHGDARNFLAENQNRFRLITGFDIIEHFGKDEQFRFLELVVNGLYPGGRLILQTPNAESPWFGAVAYGDYTHEWFFTPASLAHILRLSGLTDIEGRASAPYVHGLKSLGRVMVWNTLNTLVEAVEYGRDGRLQVVASIQECFC
jgi:SAM-dependent methyltransferase